MRLEKNECCFYCQYFYHMDPDTDVCRIDDHEVYVDTPKCDQFKEDAGPP